MLKTNLSDMRSRMEEFFNSVDGEEYLNRLQKERDAHMVQMTRLVNRLDLMTDAQFSNFIDKLSAKHNDAYRDRLYRRGYMPHPNKLMTLLFDVAMEFGEDAGPVDDFAEAFSSQTKLYRGFYFCNIYGQGMVSRIHKPSKELIFSL